jgi:cysteine desulfurase
VTEHKCVLDSCRVLEQEGFQLTYLPVQKNGLVDLERLNDVLRPGETSICSVMAGKLFNVLSDVKLTMKLE